MPPPPFFPLAHLDVRKGSFACINSRLSPPQIVTKSAALRQRAPAQPRYEQEAFGFVARADQPRDVLVPDPAIERENDASYSILQYYSEKHHLYTVVLDYSMYGHHVYQR